MKFLRPRFTLCTLAIVVTLVCVYFGAWEATKRYGVEGWHQGKFPNPVQISIEPQTWETAINEEAIGPFLLQRNVETVQGLFRTYHTEYRVWLFGLGFTLPFTKARPEGLSEWSREEVFSNPESFR
jgi:hypothetical protein